MRSIPIDVWSEPCVFLEQADKIIKSVKSQCGSYLADVHIRNVTKIFCLGNDATMDIGYCTDSQ